MSLSGFQPLLAAALPRPAGGVPTAIRSLADGFVPALGAILAVVGAIVLWTILFRRRRNPSGERLRIVRPSRGGDAGRGRRGHRRRRRRERRRPSNPTLAETGGLPPTGAGEPRPPAP